MELLIYSQKYEKADAIHNFMDFYHRLNMKHLASDLLDKGMSPMQISEAIIAAIKIAKVSNLETNAHFMPVFSGKDQTIIEDCKLSHLGYGLVLMNADVNLEVVGEFQVGVLTGYLEASF
ncbi:hypothetical protein OAA67_03730 [Winogradskyella sp.]|uniref:hypothetical protein n=1 Tax=uncultured Winogradskyella sp. TaxID=395353 RepID=UPI0023758EE8|nr:hypothetical protein [Winogradskyella sp.]MDC0006753.1 hypothetical protein [Winogradskyella sp.]MDC1504106.1 hypothetical protein [Winogradskyella sp.]|tara:strand:+ start:8458 stop:8817 length:360 start_codon:yes stop_codon:yes gene_type:complete